MAHILIMPRQGNTVESCIITDWKVKEGASVTEQTIVCEVETDKASFEVPAGAAGTVLKILYAAGDDVPVLSPIAVIGAAGEDWQAAVSKEPSGAGQSKTEEAAETPKNTASLEQKEKQNRQISINNNAAGVSPRARNLAGKQALPLEFAAGSGPGGRIIERDIIAAMQNQSGLTAAAKAAAGLAASAGAGTIPAAGSGIGGRVTKADLAAAPGKPVPVSGEGAVIETPIKGIRKIISDRMLQSLAESAQFTLNAGAPAQRMQDFRSRMKSASQGSFIEEMGLSKITVNDLILFAVSRLLPRFPFMNAHKTGDTLKTFERVHLGVAVDTPRGLLVPVIRNANLLSLSQISQEAKRLAAACQNNAVKPDELSGSTFTVTNLGSLGVTGFTPVLNIPEVAILGVCSIELKPVASPEGVLFLPYIGFSLTINHQVVDGAPAARFLKALCDAIADIDLLLVTG